LNDKFCIISVDWLHKVWTEKPLHHQISRSKLIVVNCRLMYWCWLNSGRKKAVHFGSPLQVRRDACSSNDRCVRRAVIADAAAAWWPWSLFVRSWLLLSGTVS